MADSSAKSSIEDSSSEEEQIFSAKLDFIRGQSETSPLITPDSGSAPSMDVESFLRLGFFSVLRYKRQKSLPYLIFDAYCVFVMVTSGMMALVGPVLLISTGIHFIDKCPADRRIPVIFIVESCFWFLALISRKLFKQYAFTGGLATVSAALFCHIAESVCVYSMKHPDFTDTASKKYCNEAFYHTAYWTVTCYWVLLALIVILFVWWRFLPKIRTNEDYQLIPNK